MTCENSSILAINIVMGYVLSVMVIIVSNGVIVAAQQYDFGNTGPNAVKPGLCPRPDEVDSQDLSNNCESDASCHGAKKCCKANTGAMLCLKAGSTNGCEVRGRILQQGESALVDCYNCTCLSDSTLMCPSYNCSGVVDQVTTPSNTGRCPTVIDFGECFAHMPCQQDSDCNGGKRCCDVQCGIPICINQLEVPDIGSGCTIGDKYYSPGERSNISDTQLDCHNCLCKSDGQWHCHRHLCTAKLKATAGGTARGADFLTGMSLIPLILSILYILC